MTDDAPNLPSILLTHPWETRSRREMSHERTPRSARRTMHWRMFSGKGRPLTNVPPSWFTPPTCIANSVANCLTIVTHQSFWLNNANEEMTGNKERCRSWEPHKARSCLEVFISVNKKAELSHRRPGVAPNIWVPWKISRVLTTRTATFTEICNGLLFRSILRMRIQNLKFVALPVPGDNRGYWKKFGPRHRSAKNKIWIKTLHECKGYNARQFTTVSGVKVGRIKPSTGC